MPIPCRVLVNLPLFLIPTLTSRLRSQYKTGKTLRKDRYTLVKEAAEIKTGTYYACKVIKKTFTKNEALAVDSSV